MSSFNQVYIGGYPTGGLINDRKPFLVADDAFTELDNAYVWRNRVKKREGIKLVGRLERVFSEINFFLTGASPWTFNVLVRSGYISAANNANPGQITTTSPHGLTTGDVVIITGVIGATGYNNTTFTITSTGTNTFTVGVNAAAFGAYAGGGYFISNRAWGTLQPNAEVAPGSFSITFGGNTYIDNGQGVIALSVSPFTVVGSINYITGSVTLTNTGGGGVTTVLNFSYYPSLPVMGINKQDIAIEGIENTIYFDTTYAYQYVSGSFQELAPGTVWTGNQTDFFWATNFQNQSSSQKTFFVTNNNITQGQPTPYDPIRYYFNGVWNDLQPILTETGPVRMFQALILIPYYGRLLALNTWEGTTVDNSQNYYARCRFSQIGDPTQNGSVGPYVPGSWASDVFGIGGAIDAPTNESIVSASFFRNTLIVFFEYSTWQLRYIGEYGTPFIWERISSDFGCNSTFSSIIFDRGVMAVSNRGIISASAGGLERIDENIPETAFTMIISSPLSGTNNQNFVHGIRDFEKELVYWNYIDSSLIDSDLDVSENEVYPNTVLLYNYRNNTWAIFRDNVTCFGTAQFSTGVNWDSFTANWNSDISWNSLDSQTDTNFVVAGNQQGFVHVYEYPGTPDLNSIYPSILDFDPSLSISSIDLTVTPVEITVINHNLRDLEIIYIVNTMWVGTDPGLNNRIYQIRTIDNNTLSLSAWNPVSEAYSFVPAVPAPPTYIGGGALSLLPVINIVTKDFNPYQNKGLQFKLSYIDFLFNTSREQGIAGFNIKLFTNTYVGPTVQSNMFLSNQDVLNSGASGIISGVILTQTGSITAVTNSSNALVTSNAHGLTTGTTILITNILGMTELNGNSYNITVVDINSFLLNVNSSGFGIYTGAGNWSTPTIITSKNYSLPTGTKIILSGIVGTTQLNNNIYTITVIDANNFSLNGINSTGFSAYISSGAWNLINNPKLVNGSQYSDYRWYRFYATSYGQYLRVAVTYDAILMNQLCTHQTGFEMYGMNFWFRPGGRMINEN